MLAEGKALERGGDLIGLLHTGSHWPSTDEDNDISVSYFSVFDRGHGAGFRDKDSRWSDVGVRSIFIKERRINGGAFDYATLRRKIAYREAQSSPKPASVRTFRREDDVFSINAVERQQAILHRATAVAAFPPIEIVAEGFSGHGA